MARYRLGRKAVKTDSRTLRFAKYAAALAAPPASVDWTKGITQWGMMLNDALGDCTIAGIGHAIQVWTANASTEITLPDQVILDYYEWWDGYVDGDPSTDDGGIEIDVLNHWKKKKFWGHKLDAFVDPDVSNLTEIQQAINLFGPLYIGLNVPESVMNTDNDPSIPWDVTGDNTLVGGHCVVCVGYEPGYISLISWGSVYRMTTAFWAQFVDEAHCLLSQDWISSSGVDPAGFNLPQLRADLAAIV
jgi:hypothetical protein